MMNVISGIYKNRPLITPTNGVTHPMGSREKLALFNMVSPYLKGACVLDAFAGSGALGIEALSRGAELCVFIDKNTDSIRAIMKNLETLGAEDKAAVICLKVTSYSMGREFDVIFADPPYDKFEVADIIHLTSLLKPGGILGLSHPGEAPRLPGLTLTKSHKYAAAHISIYEFVHKTK